MSEMVDLRAELNAMKKGAREMEEEILTLKKETETLKAKGLPFEVDYRDKTVLLVGWNLKVLASEEDEGVREPRKMPPTCKEDCGKGNLIVGRRHRYSGAAESFFSGYGHNAEGYGHAFLGGHHNKAAHAHNAIAGGYTNVASGESGFIAGARMGKTGKLASTIVGGFGNTCNSSLAVVVGGKDNVVKLSASYSVVIGGVNNLMLSTAWPSAIFGGQSNLINHNGSGVIMAGYNNTLMTMHAFTVGGASNMINSPNARHSGMVGGIGNLLAGWGVGEGNLVMGGHMYNASSYEPGTWGRKDKEYEIVPITWKPANVPPPTWKPPQ